MLRMPFAVSMALILMALALLLNLLTEVKGVALLVERKVTGLVIAMKPGEVIGVAAVAVLVVVVLGVALSVVK